MLSVQFQITGDEVIHRALDFSAKDIGTLREPMDDIGRTLRKTFDMNFSTRGAEYGGWKPRKPQMSKGRRIDTWPLMEKTGRLRKNFKQDTTNTSVTLFNPTSYFPYHQQGTSRLPRRVMMALREQDGRMIVGTIQQYCIEVLRRRGLR